MDTCITCDGPLPEVRYAGANECDTCKRFREVFLPAYIKTALWASHDEEDNLLDWATSHDLTRATYAAMESDARAFFTANHHLWEPRQDGDAAANFWLTRNNHGTGFWDSPEVWGDATDALTESSHAFPEVILFYIDSTGEIEQFSA